jgi:uncharacterized protein YjbI with pentapeptide repeats
MNAPEPSYRQPVLEALCAFVRDRTRSYTGDEPPPTDVQAALTVIGRRRELGQVDLSNSHMHGATLTDAKLDGAFLAKVDLSGANLRSAHLNTVLLIDSDLRHAALDGSAMHSAFLDNTNLSQADLRADLAGASLNGANLSKANLLGAILDHADLTNANLTGANLGAATLSQANLAGAVLIGADLSAIDLRGATVSQNQLDTACGSSTAMKLPLRLSIKPCKH